MESRTIVSTRSIWQTWLLAKVTEYYIDGEVDYATVNWAIRLPKWLDWFPSPKFEIQIVLWR